MIVELIEDSRVSPNVVQRADVVRQHCSTALANAMEHQNLFLMPVWRALGKTNIIFQARTLPKTLAVAAGVLLLTLVLCLWPVRTDDGVERRFGARPAAGRVRGNRRQGGRPEGRPRRSRHQGPTPIETRANSDFEVQRDQIEGELRPASSD